MPFIRLQMAFSAVVEGAVMMNVHHVVIHKKIFP